MSVHRIGRHLRGKTKTIAVGLTHARILATFTCVGRGMGSDDPGASTLRLLLLLIRFLLRLVVVVVVVAVGGGVDGGVGGGFRQCW